MTWTTQAAFGALLLSAAAGCGEDAPVGAPAACAAEIGTCSETHEACGCDTTCMRLGADRYECKVGCELDAQCTQSRDPGTGRSFSRCVPAEDLTHETFGRYCE